MNVLIDAYMIMENDDYISVSFHATLDANASLVTELDRIQHEAYARYPMAVAITMYNLRLLAGLKADFKPHVPSKKTIHDLFPMSNSNISSKSDRDSSSHSVFKLPPPTQGKRMVLHFRDKSDDKQVEPVSPETKRITERIAETKTIAKTIAKTTTEKITETKKKPSPPPMLGIDPSALPPQIKPSTKSESKRAKICQGCIYNAASQSHHTCLVDGSSSSALSLDI